MNYLENFTTVGKRCSYYQAEAHAKEISCESCKNFISGHCKIDQYDRIVTEMHFFDVTEV